jgi:hypothetical protein
VKKLNLSFLLMACLSLSACTSKAPKKTLKDTVSIESKQLATEEESNFVSELTFVKGSAKLSSASRKKLKTVFQEAAAKGKVVEAKLVTWADREYPSVHTQELTNKEKLLVDNRNKNIEVYLHGLNGEMKVDAYSMAKRPSTMSRLFSTENARIKKSLETAGVPNTDTAVKVPGKASRSIVILLNENARL